MGTSSRIGLDVTSFNQDAEQTGQYLYTTRQRLSFRYQDERCMQVTLSLADFTNRRVLDVGCGDGTYTIALFESAGLQFAAGIDLAPAAIAAAQRQAGDRPLEFRTGSAYELPYPDDAFDIVYLRAILHHMDDPQRALQEALRVAPRVVVLENNGLSVGRKVLERFSKYHLEHNERSFAPATWRKWVQASGGSTSKEVFAVFVPLFAPDVVARGLKLFEPVVERLPVARVFGCALYAFLAERTRRASVAEAQHGGIG